MPQSISVWKMFSGIHNSSNQNLSANDSNTIDSIGTQYAGLSSTLGKNTIGAL